MDKARLEAFSDGVFGFAITLLVLGIQVPSLKTVSEAELRTGLAQCLSQLVPYVTSFATIGIIWLNHHAMFHSVERVEHTTLSESLTLACRDIHSLSNGGIKPLWSVALEYIPIWVCAYAARSRVFPFVDPYLSKETEPDSS